MEKRLEVAESVFPWPVLEQEVDAEGFLIPTFGVISVVEKDISFVTVMILGGLQGGDI